MDSADKNTLQKAVSSHDMLLGEHHQLLQGLLETQQALGNQISQMGRCLERISGQLAPSPALPPPPPPQPLRESPVPPPEPYAGDLGRCKGFQLQCSLVFSPTTSHLHDRPGQGSVCYREKNYKSHTPVNAFAATPTLARVASGLSETHGSGPSSSALSDEPMQVCRANLTPAERQRRIRAGECIYCGQVGHFLAACPLRPKERAHQ